MTRLAIIRKSKCHSRKCSKECISVCPRNRMGEECVFMGEDNKAQINEELCVGCGICTKKCPFEAITIINLPEQLREKPVFRYGENQFELFRLPIPKKGSVVGILGINGIGKTTAIEILSGLKKPNLGELNKKLLEKEIISTFKGTELQNYFTKLFANKIDVAYKPQYVDQIPRLFKGTVIQLLEKQGTKTRVKEISKKLRITDVLDRKLNDLSGGELQKVAIAAAMLKAADLYFFDEPASYLDVKERIAIAKVIQELAQEKAVLVVEHDLIILDYLADSIHILFGKTACYGIVSHPLSARNGVNTYLEGYIRNENIRFRAEPIKFHVRAGATVKNEDILASWSEIKKKLGSFSLESDKSEIRSREIVGIVGANGIGKTTFVKILAGVLKADKGKINKKLKIAYKPQHIEQKKDTVLGALSAITKNVMTQKYKLEILRPLELEHLLNRSLDSLSGGELQRVYIAACLSYDADLYLFDEPSTYLDVEQRLQAARTIQKVIKSREAAALIVDHDLMLINHISDRIMVFNGVPAKKGRANKIESVDSGMNFFLKKLDITLRQDLESGRPRVNKAGSQKDREQKKSGKYYISK